MCPVTGAAALAGRVVALGPPRVSSNRQQNVAGSPSIARSAAYSGSGGLPPARPCGNAGPEANGTATGETSSAARRSPRTPKGVKTTIAPQPAATSISFAYMFVPCVGLSWKLHIVR